jgi:hypothetical protein
MDATVSCSSVVAEGEIVFETFVIASLLEQLADDDRVEPAVGACNNAVVCSSVLAFPCHAHPDRRQ